MLLPLTYWPFTYDGYVLPKLSLARLVALLLIVSMAFRAKTLRRTPLDLPLLAFVLSAALSTVFAVNPNVAVFGTYSRYDGLLTLITYALLFWLVVQALRDVEDAVTLTRFLLVGGYAVAVAAIIQWSVDSFQGRLEPRALGTMGNANVLGAYLALLIPVAYGELRQADSIRTRLLAANVLVVMAIAAALSMSYSTWLGLVAAAAVLFAAGQLPVIRSRAWQIAGGIAAVSVVAAAAPVALSRSTVGERLHIWRDTLQLIASRPIAGYGPDTFGFVYPRFQTGPWVPGYLQIDKAHSEILQVAATQGLIGLAAWAWLMVAFALALGRSRSWAALAGFVAYQFVLLLNFTALPAAFPFWMFAAAAMHRGGSVTVSAVAFPVPVRALAGVAAGGLIVVGVGLPLYADRELQLAVNADVGRPPRQAAAAHAADALRAAPQESVYSVEIGNVAYEVQDWPAATAAYEEADRLGTFNPEMYRDLALADLRLGRRAQAMRAALEAVYLDPFDPANQAVLAQVQQSS